MSQRIWGVGAGVLMAALLVPAVARAQDKSSASGAQGQGQMIMMMGGDDAKDSTKATTDSAAKPAQQTGQIKMGGQGGFQIKMGNGQVINLPANAIKIQMAPMKSAKPTVKPADSTTVVADSVKATGDSTPGK